MVSMVSYIQVMNSLAQTYGRDLVYLLDLLSVSFNLYNFVILYISFNFIQSNKYETFAESLFHI